LQGKRIINKKYSTNRQKIRARLGLVRFSVYTFGGLMIDIAKDQLKIDIRKKSGTNFRTRHKKMENFDRAKQRLGDKAKNVKWIVADAATFQPIEKYDFWHDRAAFHFLTDEQEISNYLQTAQQNINSTGVLLIGTFSEQGPKNCSGIEIKQYSETTMTDRLRKFFEKIKCISVNHKTPFDTIQNFVFFAVSENYKRLDTIRKNRRAKAYRELCIKTVRRQTKVDFSLRSVFLVL
jgi:hypothetical protein